MASALLKGAPPTQKHEGSVTSTVQTVSVLLQDVPPTLNHEESALNMIVGQMPALSKAVQPTLGDEDLSVTSTTVRKVFFVLLKHVSPKNAASTASAGDGRAQMSSALKVAPITHGDCALCREGKVSTLTLLQVATATL